MLTIEMANNLPISSTGYQTVTKTHKFPGNLEGKQYKIMRDFTIYRKNDNNPEKKGIKCKSAYLGEIDVEEEGFLGVRNLNTVLLVVVIG